MSHIREQRVLIVAENASDVFSMKVLLPAVMQNAPSKTFVSFPTNGTDAPPSISKGAIFVALSDLPAVDVIFCGWQTVPPAILAHLSQKFKETPFVSVGCMIPHTAFVKSMCVLRDPRALSTQHIESLVAGVALGYCDLPIRAAMVDIVPDELLSQTAVHGFIWWMTERSILTRMVITVSTSSSNPLQWRVLCRYVLQYLEGPFPKELSHHLAPRPRMGTGNAQRIKIAAQEMWNKSRGTTVSLRPALLQSTAALQKNAIAASTHIRAQMEHHPTAPMCDEYLRFLHSSTFHEIAQVNDCVDAFAIEWELVVKHFARNALCEICRAVSPSSELSLPPVVKRFTQDRLFGGPESSRRLPLVGNLLWASARGVRPSGRSVQMIAGCSPAIKEKIIQSQQVQEAIAVVCRDQNISHFDAIARSHDILNQMGDNLNERHIRIAAMTMRGVFKKMYSRVCVNSEAWSILRHCFYSHQSERTGIVLIPSHRSYIDFLIVSYVLLCLDAPIPHICAGEDFLRLGIVATILRGSGGFFMRRSFKGDVLYTALFSEYIRNLMYTNQCIEFFIEGTRSRSGKTLAPRVGVLKLLVDAFTKQDMKAPKIDDVLFIPISLSYDRVLEEGSYADELLGTPKPGETLSNLWRSLGFLKSNFGAVHVTVGTPISLRRFLPGAMLNLAGRIVSKLETNMTVCPSALMCSVMLRLHEAQELSDGLPASIIVAEMEWLRGWVLHCRGHIMQQWSACSGEKILEHACAMLPNIASMTSLNSVRVVSSPRTVLMMQLYENQLVSLFVPRAILECTKRSQGAMPYETMCVLLNNEFPLLLDAHPPPPPETLETYTSISASSYLCSLILPYIEVYWFLVMWLTSCLPLPSKVQDVSLITSVFESLQCVRMTPLDFTDKPTLLLRFESFTPVRDNLRNALDRYRASSLVRKDGESLIVDYSAATILEEQLNRCRGRPASSDEKIQVQRAIMRSQVSKPKL